MSKKALPKLSEPVPPVLKGMGSAASLGMVWLATVPLAVISGQAYPNILLISLSAFTHSLAFLGYFLYKPLNPFSDNFYASKSFHRLTAAELKALGYLNTWDGKVLILKIAFAMALLTALGEICRWLGLVFKDASSTGEAPLTNLLVAGVVPGLVALVNYPLLTCRILWKRWDWILQHQPLPEAAVLAKYARGKKVGEWDHLYGTEFSEEMDRMLEGKVSPGSWRRILQLVGAGMVLIPLLRLATGTLAEGREAGAWLILGAGLVVLALASLLKREKRKRKPNRKTQQG